MSETAFRLYDEEAGSRFLSWWKSLEFASGDRASLRRARSLSELALISSFHRLRRDLGVTGDRQIEALAAAAVVLSNIRRHVPAKNGGFGGQLRGRLSDLRLRALLDADDPEEVMRRLPRAIALMDSAADVVAAARIAFGLSLESLRDRTRLRIAQDFYDADTAIETSI